MGSVHLRLDLVVAAANQVKAELYVLAPPLCVTAPLIIDPQGSRRLDSPAQK